MIQTVTVDIINEKALKLLQDLESLQLIRLHKDQKDTFPVKPDQFKGAMTKQSIAEIESQINDLRSGWE